MFDNSTLGLQDRRTFKWLVERYVKNINLLGVLLIINPIGFKEINKAYGFEFGDEVLISIAKRLKSTLKEYNVIAKLESDKFGVFLKGFRKKEDVIFASQEFLNTLRESYVIRKRIISLSFNIGLSVSPIDGSNSESLLDKANIALFDASQKGENTIGFFKKELKVKAQNCLNLKRDLEKSITEKNIVAYYQPYVDKDKKIIGAEALMRWIKDGKIIPPMEFIDYLESSDLIINAEKLVSNQVFSDLKEFSNLNIDMNCSFNLSERSLRQENISNFILSSLSEYKIKGINLRIEIIERTLINNFNYLNSLIKSLRKHDIYFALDDFGTGYSSLSYISNLFIKYLKIDISFINKMLYDDRTKFIIESIISLSQKLNIKTIAEGVETLEQFEILKSMGCDYFQGFLFYRPMPKEQFFGAVKNDITSSNVNYN